MVSHPPAALLGPDQPLYSLQTRAPTNNIEAYDNLDAMTHQGRSVAFVGLLDTRFSTHDDPAWNPDPLQGLVFACSTTRQEASSEDVSTA